MHIEVKIYESYINYFFATQTIPDTKIIKEKLFLIISYFYNVKTIHIDFICGFIFKSAHDLYNDIHSQSKNILYIH